MQRQVETGLLTVGQNYRLQGLAASGFERADGISGILSLFLLNAPVLGGLGT